MYDTPIKQPLAGKESPQLSFNGTKFPEGMSSLKTDFHSQFNDFSEEEDQNFSLFINDLCGSDDNGHKKLQQFAASSTKEMLNFDLLLQESDSTHSGFSTDSNSTSKLGGKNQQFFITRNDIPLII